MPRLFDFPFVHIADVYFVYAFCNRNARAAMDEYRHIYLGRHVYEHWLFISLHRHLWEFGLVL